MGASVASGTAYLHARISSVKRRIQPRARTARRLRHSSTDVEQQLWVALREARLPIKVRRQHPIGGYIVDFAFPQCKLAIELDGGQHDEMRDRDAHRTAVINEHGYEVLRFWNSDVVENIEGVLERIQEAVAVRAHLTPTLSSPEGGEGED